MSQHHNNIIILITLLHFLTYIHSLQEHGNPNYHLPARFYCTSITNEKTEGRVYSSTYFINHYIEKGQVSVRSFLPLSHEYNVSQIEVNFGEEYGAVIVEYYPWTVTYAMYNDVKFSVSGNNSASSLDMDTDMFQLQSLPIQFRKDKYYKRMMNYYTINFDKIQHSRDLSIQYIQIQTTNGTNTTIIPDSKTPCADFSDSSTMYYHYFQPSYSKSSVVCSAFLSITSIAILGMQIMFRNYTLVRSRLLSEIPCGIALLISDLIMLIAYGVDMYYMNRKGVRNIPVISTLSYVRGWAIYTGCCCYVLNSLRYLYMLNFYRLVKQDRDIMRFNKIVTSKLTFIILLSISSLVMAAVLSSTTRIGMKSISTSGIIGSIVTAAASAVVLVSGLSCIIIEMVSSITMIKKHGIIAYFRRDPLYIRIQMFILLPAIMFAVPYAVVCTFIDADYASLNTTYFVVIVNALLLVAFGIIGRLLMGGAFVCCVQLWFICFHRRSEKKDTSDDMFLNAMADPECYDMMFEYCKREFSLENLIFWQDLKGLNDNVTYETVEKIGDKYVKPYSCMQVNLPGPVVKNYLKLMEMMKLNQMKHIQADDVRKVVLQDVLSNLNDTFSRFVRTNEFEEWEKNCKASKQLIDSQFAL